MSLIKYWTAFSVFTVIAGVTLPASAIVPDPIPPEVPLGPIPPEEPAGPTQEFGFSFSNEDNPRFDGTTVEGNVVLPEGDGSDLEALSVTVNSINLDGEPVGRLLNYQTPVDFTQLEPAFPSQLNSSVNSFTVEDGEIVKEESVFTKAVFTPRERRVAFEIGNGPFDASLLNLAGSSNPNTGIIDRDDSTLTYTSASTEPVPFEAEGTMGLVALGGFLFYRHRKKRKQALSQESN